MSVDLRPALLIARAHPVGSARHRRAVLLSATVTGPYRPPASGLGTTLLMAALLAAGAALGAF